MDDYDVIVVGAGPAGSSAAKIAAEKGARTILLEEHSKIGRPQHCTGRIHGTKSGIGEDILSTLSNSIRFNEIKSRRIFSPRGRVVEVSLAGMGVWTLDRARFDLQLASQAVNAGTEIQLNTKVTGLLTHGSSIVGVKTNSKNRPVLHGKVVIAADGIKSQLGGIPIWSGLAEVKQEAMSGLVWCLAGVNGVEPETLELHLSSEWGGKRGWIWMQRIDPFSCLTDFDSFKDFETCRNGDSDLSKKIKNAVPLQITGWAHPSKIGIPLQQKVKSGLILTGAAAGYHPFLVCLLSGRFAGEVAGDAVKNGNTTEDSLTSYNTLCENLQDTRKLTFSSFFNRSDNELEKIFDDMANMDITEFDVLPL